MKRSGFQRKVYLRAPRPPLVRQLERARAVMASGDRMAEPVPKAVEVRSDALVVAYRALACQWPGCGVSDGTVCCAHSNFTEYGGKGGMRKADDNFAASLCFDHHSALDQGSRLSYEERKAGWLAAHLASVRELVARGLWPVDVALPWTLADGTTYNPRDAWAVPQQTKEAK